MRLLHLDELQRMGGNLSADNTLSFANNVFTKGGTFPKTSQDFVVTLAEKYRNCGVECLITEASGMITIWRLTKTPDTQVPTKRLTIVHVDDSPVEGKIMERIAQKLNCNFVKIDDSVLAVPRILKLKTKPDFIFLDLNMPIVNGYEVCAQLRRIEAFKDIPIVILTANDGLVDRVRAKMVGATDFMSKPIEREKVSQVITKYMNKK
jgi:CheY-like chemotaxis protein